VIVQCEEFPIVCELKEDLNFHTVNGIPSTVLGVDIITYETKSESLTLVLPTMYITVVRKGRGIEGSNINYSGACHRNKFDSE